MLHITVSLFILIARAIRSRGHACAAPTGRVRPAESDRLAVPEIVHFVNKSVGMNLNFAIAAAVVGVVLLCLSPLLKKWLHGVE